MKHADNIMQTAGSDDKLDEKKFSNEMDEINRRISDSYFFLSDILYAKYQDNINVSDEIRYMLKIMCENIVTILKNKSEGYNHLRSLLETEIPQIMKCLDQRSDVDVNWKTDFIYYLFLESRIVRNYNEPEKGCNILNVLEKILNDITKSLENNTNTEAVKELLRSKVKLLISKAAFLSQSSEDNYEELVCGICKDALNILNGIQTDGIINEADFEITLQLYFLFGKILGRCSTILELERCKQREQNGDKQLEKLCEMFDKLDAAYKLITERQKNLGFNYEEFIAQYNFLIGEYYFKMSQYYWENLQYDNNAGEADRKEMNDCYGKAYSAYNNSLKYYDNNPSRFSFERANLMRSMGDLFFQKSKSCNSNQKENRKDCFKYLYSAYKIYRNNANLHGIADVLQSMGNTEDYIKSDLEKQRRSAFCFYNTSKELYRFLGDGWNYHIVERFLEEARDEQQTFLGLSIFHPSGSRHLNL